MQNFNFFQWIREGVRQSVLMGVSDAVEQLGAAPEIDSAHPALANLLKTSPALGSQATGGRLGNTAAKKAPAKKRLGKSLKEITAEPTGNS
ncbi:MAG: hypothetical protein D6753_09635 [Planctomycetota bacterium]|nr:MAG: hypothetical protein D6753_09635 [Planctomycetota bacterium]